jgi:predicted nucleic acid-binding protein
VNEDDLDSFDAVVCDDAVASIIFAMRALRDGSAQEASWAARRAWDTLDYYANNIARPDEGEQLIAAEVRRQERDLGEVGKTPDSAVAAIAEKLRKWSETDGLFPKNEAG